MNEAETQELMMQIVRKLEVVLCSYQGHGHQSVYIDMDGLAFFTGLMLRDEIKLQEYQYDYSDAIHEDKMVVGIYERLAPQTRWRVGRNTKIEQIRMNALKQFASMGEPVYEEHIYYSDTGAALVCGEILPYEIMRLFAEEEKIRTVNVFPYPYKRDDDKFYYFSFESTEKSREEMRQYVKQAFDKMYRIIRENSIFYIK